MGITKKLKENKGTLMLIGMIWGFISWYLMMDSDVRYTPAVFKSLTTGILVLPAYIVWLMFLGIGKLRILMQGTGLIEGVLEGILMIIFILGVIPVLSPVVGILIGYIIGKLIEKVRK